MTQEEIEIRRSSLLNDLRIVDENIEFNERIHCMLVVARLQREKSELMNELEQLTNID